MNCFAPDVDNEPFPNIASTPMKILRGRSFQFIAALFALLAFSADTLDEICDRAERAQCNQTSQSGDQQKPSCPNSGCQNHSEAAVISDVALPLHLRSPDADIFELGNAAAPRGLPASIDHPPQLA